MSKSMVLQGGYPGLTTSVYVHTNIEHLAPGNALVTFYMAGVSMTIQMTPFEMAELANMLNTARAEIEVTA